MIEQFVKVLITNTYRNQPKFVYYQNQWHELHSFNGCRNPLCQIYATSHSRRAQEDCWRFIGRQRAWLDGSAASTREAVAASHLLLLPDCKQNSKQLHVSRKTTIIWFFWFVCLQLNTGLSISSSIGLIRFDHSMLNMSHYSRHLFNILVLIVAVNLIILSSWSWSWKFWACHKSGFK